MLRYIHNDLRPMSHYFQRTPVEWNRVRQSTSRARGADELIKCAITALHEGVGVIPKLITGTADNGPRSFAAGRRPPHMKMSLQSLGALGAFNLALCRSAGTLGSALCAMVGAPLMVAMGRGRSDATVMQLAQQGCAIGAQFGRETLGGGAFVIAEALRTVLRIMVNTVLSQSENMVLSSYVSVKWFKVQASHLAKQSIYELRKLPSPRTCAAGMRR